MVIHTTGPFQSQNYRVAEAAIARRCHYADLADARAFVCGIGALDTPARGADVLVVSGASSVPCLTAAVVDDALPRFQLLERMDYGITAAQQTNRGLATASAVLSYVGKQFTTLRDGRWTRVYGWQGLHAKQYPQLGLRLFGYCDIPDLDIFPRRYPTLRTMRFGAGHEIKLLHLSTWLLSWLVRIGVIHSLAPHAETLLRWSFLFDALGTSTSGFHAEFCGLGHDGKSRRERFYMIARSGHGPLIPCMPAILLARRFARNQLTERGARACLDLIDLEEYLNALAGLDIAVLRKMPGVAWPLSSAKGRA
ncbi:hypothetical protein [Sphingomonas sp.]|uniref:hypothetical protein n=1 Tax=Sphingomonas sp. TaxID=28214 RepID=UPI00182AA140|nr:hypothetical protein [Sphingomonas sp.]MBA3510982.1 potassium transporter [Sphingomonas sp.]